jgi:tetratricopeptide (TPR) repeat protein
MMALQEKPQRNPSADGYLCATRLAVLAVALLPLFVYGQSQTQLSPRQLFQEAYQAQQQGKLKLAVREYKQLLQAHPEIIPARANLAAALDSLGRHGEAIAQYQAALKQLPGNPQLELALALEYFKNSDNSSAARSFDLLHKADPANERIAILLADCDLRLGHDHRAVRLLSPFEAGDSNNLDLEWALGSALVGAGRAAEGVQRVQRVADEGHSAQAYLLAAQTYLKLERYDLARRDVRAAIHLSPKLPGADTLDGIIDSDFEDPTGATAAFERAIKSNHNDFQAQLQFGGLLYKQRKLPGAEQHLLRALQLQPSSAPANYELGLVEKAEGKLPAALKNLRAAEQEKPNWLPPHIELSALYFRLRQPKDGLREKKMVDRLSALQQQHASKLHVISPGAP